MKQCCIEDGVLYDDDIEPMCDDCRDEKYYAQSLYWGKMYRAERRPLEGGYELTDPKHPEWAERVLEMAE